MNFVEFLKSLYEVTTNTQAKPDSTYSKLRRQSLNIERPEAKGQTRTTSKSGKTRNYRNASSANRPPTLDPVETRSNRQPTPPRRPAGGFGQAPGQLSISQITGGNNPNAKPSGNYQSPSVPSRMGTPTPAAGPDIPEGPNRNPFRNNNTTRPATGFTKKQTKSSPLSINNIANVLTGGILTQGGTLADMMLGALDTSVVEETFGTGRVYEDFQRSLNRNNTNNTTTTTTTTKPKRGAKRSTQGNTQSGGRGAKSSTRGSTTTNRGAKGSTRGNNNSRPRPLPVIPTGSSRNGSGGGGGSRSYQTPQAVLSPQEQARRSSNAAYSALTGKQKQEQGMKMWAEYNSKFGQGMVRVRAQEYLNKSKTS